MISYIKFLENITKLVNTDHPADKIGEDLKKAFSAFGDATTLNIFIIDNNTKILRDCFNEMKPLQEIYPDEVATAYNNMIDEFWFNDFIINEKAYKLPQNIEQISIKVSKLAFPIMKGDDITGLIEIGFEKETSIQLSFLSVMKIFAAVIALKIQNSVLDEKMHTNVEFYDSMKSIAKIIETQYELTYIIPLIGEMLDRFIEDHLIYVFLRNNDKFELMWPNSCTDERAKTLMSQLDCETQYLLSEDGKLGAFAMVAENNLLGCIIAKSLSERLKPGEIDYLEQLTKQASTTINRANSYSEVLQYATLDALTGLNNRRQLEVRLKQETSQAERQGHPLSVMMIDIDFFKSFNDTYGHAIGDLVLKEVATTVRQNLREADIPARYGGEEICILLPFTDLEAAKAVAERVRLGVANKIIKTSEEEGSKELNVTVSIGVAQFTAGSKPEELYIKADDALYEAKRNGRNKVEINERV
jgi:diguanylate cyclase (GGDEF)-like protein